MMLLTGGLGYIGSHTAVELLDNDQDVVIVDNLSNSQIDLKQKITGKSIKFYEGDVRDADLMDKIFSENKIDTVIHFAGFKAVGESTKIPIEYYKNNIDSTLVLLEAMKKHNVKNLVFSSSATVYGKAKSMPIFEDFPLSASNPYGRTKLFIEEILKDVHAADPSFNIAILRYFNPVGAHESGIIGENPNGIPNNLMPYITRVATKKLDLLHVFGNDYETHDGTGVRDYIHVCDLAHGHLKAAQKLENNPGLVVYNLGTGTGYSVLDMVKAFESSCKVSVPYVIDERRPGDIDTCFASPEKADKELGFKATRTLEDMCKSSFNFEVNNK